MPRTYTVQPGDSFARIAGRVYGDQRMLGELQRANPNVGVLQPGQTIRLPGKKQNPVVTEAELSTPAPLPTGQGDEVQETHVNPYSGMGEFFGPGSGQGGAETGFGQSAQALAEQLTGADLAHLNREGINEVTPGQDPGIVQPILNPADRALIMRAARFRAQPAPQQPRQAGGTAANMSDEEIFNLRRRGRLTQLRETALQGARSEGPRELRPGATLVGAAAGQHGRAAWQWWAEGVREQQAQRGRPGPTNAQIEQQRRNRAFLFGGPGAVEAQRFDDMLNETASDPSMPAPADLAHLNREGIDVSSISSPEAGARARDVAEVAASTDPSHLTMGQLAWAGRYTGLAMEWALETEDWDRYMPTKLSTDMIMILPQYHRKNEDGTDQFASVSDFAHTMGYEWDDGIGGWRLRGAGGGGGRRTGGGGGRGFGGFGGGGGGRRRGRGRSRVGGEGPFQWRISID